MYNYVLFTLILTTLLINSQCDLIIQKYLICYLRRFELGMGRAIKLPYPTF